MHAYFFARKHPLLKRYARAISWCVRGSSPQIMRAHLSLINLPPTQKEDSAPPPHPSRRHLLRQRGGRH